MNTNEETNGHNATDLPATDPLGGINPPKIHPETILIPLDFSRPAEKALEYGKAFARHFGAKLALIHVLEPMVIPAELGYGFVPPPDDALPVEALRQKLAAMAAELGTDIVASSQVRIGRPWSEVVDAAKESSADLLIVATHGRTGLQHVLLGSVAEKIIRHAPCPVLVVRSDERDFI